MEGSRLVGECMYEVRLSSGPGKVRERSNYGGE